MPIGAGQLVATLGLDVSNFIGGSAKARTELRGLNQTTTSAGSLTQQFALKTERTSPHLKELALQAGSATRALSHSGLSGGLAAALPLLGNLGFAAGPVIGVMTTLGAVVGERLVDQFAKGKQAAAELKSEITDLLSAIEHQAGRTAEGNELSRFVRRPQDLKDVRQQRESMAEELRRLNVQIQEAEKNRNSLQSTLPGRFLSPRERERNLSEGALKVDRDNRAKIAGIETDLKQKLERRADLQSRIALLAQKEADERSRANRLDRAHRLDAVRGGEAAFGGREAILEQRRQNEDAERQRRNQLIEIQSQRETEMQQRLRAFAAPLQADQLREQFLNELLPNRSRRKEIVNATADNARTIDSLSIAGAEKQRLHALNALSAQQQLKALAPQNADPLAARSLAAGSGDLSDVTKNFLALQAPGGTNSLQDKQLARLDSIDDKLARMAAAAEKSNIRDMRNPLHKVQVGLLKR